MKADNEPAISLSVYEKTKKHALSVAPRLLIVKVPVKLIILNSFAHENLLVDVV